MHFSNSLTLGAGEPIVKDVLAARCGRAQRYRRESNGWICGYFSGCSSLIGSRITIIQIDDQVLAAKT